VENRIVLYLIQTAIVVFGLIAVLFRMRCDVRAAWPSIFRVLKDYDALAGGSEAAMRRRSATITFIASAEIVQTQAEALDWNRHRAFCSPHEPPRSPDPELPTGATNHDQAVRLQTA
jgi:hypothetical protein